MPQVDLKDRKSLVASRARAQRRLRQLRSEEHKTKALIVRRNAQLKALPVKSDARRACDYALSKVGTVEKPPFSNRGAIIDVWQKNSMGITGQPWCQCFVNGTLVHVGGQQFHTGYTPAVVQWARNRQYGLRVVSLANIKPGDWVYYKWPGVSRDTCDHVGIYVGNGKVVEGNTSPGQAGSQNNGGGVFIRTIAERRPYIVAVVRPPYRH